MKKLFSLVLVVALVLAMAITASAATVDAVNGTDSAEVKASYEAGTTAGDVYSVVVAFGSMEFTYYDRVAGSWNTSNHNYDGVVEAHWDCEDGADTITVTNNSNVAIVATATAECNEDGLEITCGDAITLEVAAEETAATPDTITVEVSGALDSETADNTVIGEVTVTITKKTA